MHLRRLVLATAFVTACGAPAAPAKPPAEPVAAVAPGPQKASEEAAAVPIFADDAVKGPREAPVTIVVYSDFECPACRVFAGGIEQIRARYAPSDTRLVFKNFPLRQHANARMVAEVGQGVLATRGADSFFRFHDAAFARQGAASDPAVVLRWAEAAGASTDEIGKGLADHRWASKIDRDMEQGRKLGLRGTPTIYVNGIDVEDEEELTQAIAGQLVKASELVTGGLARDKVYATLTDANRTAQAQAQKDEEPAPDTSVWKVPVGTSPVRGPKNALVTVVVFSDFECPFCKRVEPTIARLEQEYAGKIRIVWKDQPLPFHKRALPAARLAREARRQKGEPAFWKAHDALFESSPKLEDEDLQAVAKQLGLDVAKAMTAVRATTQLAAIEDDQVLADDVDAGGTPHFFVNGRRLAGALPFDMFKSLVDEELTKASALVAQGTPAEAVYDAVIKDGKSAPPPERVAVAVPAKAPTRGAAGAKIVIQEFSDFQCPFCKRVEPTIDALLAANPGKIKVVWRHLPLSFHPQAPLAAEAAHEAYAQKGDAGFSKMRELLFEHQGDPGGLEREALDGYAKKVGLDAKRFANALDTHAHEAAIQADKEAAEQAQLRGTPNFVIGPFVLTGAQPLRKFQRVVNLALAEKPAK